MLITISASTLAGIYTFILSVLAIMMIVSFALIQHEFKKLADNRALGIYWELMVGLVMFAMVFAIVGGFLAATYLT